MRRKFCQKILREKERILKTITREEKKNILIMKNLVTTKKIIMKKNDN